MDNEKQITVTSPLLPPLDELIPCLRDIWERKWLTNNGHYHQLLEKALAEYLKVPYISLFNNIAFDYGIAGVADYRGSDNDTLQFCGNNTFAVVEWD